MGWGSFSRKCAELLGDNLIGIALFGSCALGDMIPNHSNYDVLIVLKRIDKKVIQMIRKTGTFFKVRAAKDSIIPMTLKEMDEERPIRRFSFVARTKTIYGKSVASLAKLPSKQELLEDLKAYVGYLESRGIWVLTNFDLWDEARTREESYEIIKRVPFVTSIFRYIQTGQFPVTRKELRVNGNDAKFAYICDKLDKYNPLVEQEIEKVLIFSLDFLPKLKTQLEEYKQKLMMHI